jgi:hypothetical protein
MPLLLSARTPGYHLKSVKKRSNTWETLMNRRCWNTNWGVEELIHIYIYLRAKGIKSPTTFRTIYRTVKMVSYDVTELITSKHIHSTKRSLSVVAICQWVCVNTRRNTAQSETKLSRLCLKYEKMAVIKRKSTRLYWNSQDYRVKEFLVFRSGMRGEVVKSILCGPN